MDATEVVCVIDKSGSMGSIRSDAIGGFNTFLEDQQKQKGKNNLTVVLFDTEYTIWETKPIKKHEKLDTKNYVPGGLTALLDAVGRSINELQARLEKTPKAKRPDKAIFVIITDGQENSSQEFTTAQIKKMVSDCQEKNNWKFMFVGAGVNSFTEAGNIGIPKDMVSNFTASGKGVRSAYKGLSSAVASYSTRGIVDSSWKKGIH